MVFLLLCFAVNSMFSDHLFFFSTFPKTKPALETMQVNKKGRDVFFRSCLLPRLCSLLIEPSGALSFATCSLSSAHWLGRILTRVIGSNGEIVGQVESQGDILGWIIETSLRITEMQSEHCSFEISVLLITVGRIPGWGRVSSC